MNAGFVTSDGLVINDVHVFYLESELLCVVLELCILFPLPSP